MPALTPLQKKSVEAIMARCQSYLDLRYAQVRRMNPKVETVWEDFAWLQLANLRTSLSNEKAYGPIRLNVAETLLGDDEKKRRELFLRKSQNCLLGEIVEEKAKEGHGTAGSMEIHDMRTLIKSIDASLETIVAVVQTFLWWDLEDSTDWARIEKKTGLLRTFQEKGVSDENLEYYRELMASTGRPTAEEVIVYELRMFKRALELFRLRRNSELGYQMVIRRETAQAENPEMLIDAIAQQQGLLRSLQRGGTLDESMAEQFARVMNIEAGMVSPERVAPFLDNLIQANRKKLRAALNGQGSGSPVNFKRQQLEEFDQRFAELSGGRTIEEVAPV